MMTCVECGCELEMQGLYSDGDGDLYDRWECPYCGHFERENETTPEAYFMVDYAREYVIVCDLLYRLEVAVYADGTTNETLVPCVYTAKTKAQFDYIPW